MTTTPNDLDPALAKWTEQLERLSDFYHGTDAVRVAGAKYLPKLEKETDTYYSIRSKGVAAPGALTRTVDGSVGRIFATPPTLTGPSALMEAWEDIDGQGTHGDVWAAEASTWAILDGFALALVDAPQAPGPIVPLTDAPRYRPRWVLYRRNQLRKVRTAVVDGRVVLTMVALSESREVEDGEWGTKVQESVRVLRNTSGTVSAEVWQEVTNGAQKSWQRVEGPLVYVGPTEIPLAVLRANKGTALSSVRPPLLALVDKLLEFYQVACDVRHAERMACFPQPVVRGGLDSNLTLGPTSVVSVSSEGDFKWAEIAGTSLDQLRANQAERRQEIGALGLSFLVSETRQAETARAKALDSAAENATLAVAARGIEDGLNMALVFHASYTNEEAGTVSLNKNLSGDVIDAALLRVLLDMRKAGELTMQEFREILNRGRIIPAEMAGEEAVLLAEVEAATRMVGVGEPDTDDMEDAA
jgi:hypothetical protein